LLGIKSRISSLLGVFDRNGIHHFVPRFDQIHLVLESRIVRLCSIEVDLSIEAQFVSEITFPESFQQEEKPAQTSIGHIILLDTLMSNKISQIVLYGGRMNDAGMYRFNGISIFLEFEQEIFLDSCSTLRFNIGGEQQRLLWLENNSGFSGYDIFITDSWKSEEPKDTE
jgi:hypothetical protein